MLNPSVTQSVTHASSAPEASLFSAVAPLTPSIGIAFGTVKRIENLSWRPTIHGTFRRRPKPTLTALRVMGRYARPPVGVPEMPVDPVIGVWRPAWMPPEMPPTLG